jgi:four helix bundle protein
MKQNVIKDKRFAFALRIVKLYQILVEEKEFELSKQLLKSGTAIGALARETEHAESKSDFIHKMAIAQKESNETDYWLDLLYLAQFINQASYESIMSEIHEINKILAAMIITSKSRKNEKK